MSKHTYMVRTCGHERDITDLRKPWPNVGDEVPCRSSCDLVPTWRGGPNPHVRRVAQIEERDA